MCGIAGSYGVEFDADAALERLAHRGPDGRGVWTDGDITHGHVRLAIQDPLPRSDQPFIYDGMVLSYVGEVWNYRDVRAHLEDQGCRFETEGDTEVVAAALAMWGPDALPRLEGMFGLAWTNRNGDTYLARDRFGKVPLYTWREEDSLLGTGGWYWATERKALPERALEGVPVPPGHVVDLQDGSARPYWAPPTGYGRNSVTPADVQEELGRSVKERLQADVPVCCLVSGGLDSSLILALTHLLKPDVIAYAAVFREESEDLVAARRLCEDLGVPLREVHVPEPDTDALRASVRAIEVTSKTQVEIGTLCLPLAERIRADGFRVCLSGEGADELFGGYGTLARRATDDARWSAERLAFLQKMSRSDFMRVNKSFMAHGVECRTPFLSRRLVEMVLPLGIKACPPGKLLLKNAARWVLPDYVIRRKKLTFQGAAGVASYLEESLGGSQRKHYNDLAREVFGGVPRG